MSKNILTVADLNLSINSNGHWKKVLNNISFQVADAGFLGLVGESGSGKSVCSLAIMGLFPKSLARIDSGSIIYEDKNGVLQPLHSLDQEAHRKLRGKEISMIFQEPMTSLNPSMRLGNQVAEVIQFHEGLSNTDALKKTALLFDEVQLPRVKEMLRQYPHQISGGQKQRVMISMALAANPRLLIADEPTTALDVTVQKSILQLLTDLNKTRGLSMIFITHDLGIIAQVAKNVVVLRAGNLEEKGAVKDVFYFPEAAYTKGLLSCRPPLSGRPSILPTVSDFLNNKPSTAIPEDINIRSSRLKSIYEQAPLLSIKNISKWYPEKGGGKMFAVNEVSFDIFPNETIGLVGESGCGKSTLGRMLLRLIPASSGEIWYQDLNLTHLSDSALRKFRTKFQIVFQDPYGSLNPVQKIRTILMEPLDVHYTNITQKEKEAKVAAIIEKVGLNTDSLNKYPHEFSGGQRQRIGIARALIVNPEFLVCDESVSALDVSVQAQVLNLLNQLKVDFGFTMLFISHDLSVVRYMADRILVMQKGRIIEENEADHLFLSPEKEYTKTLINAIPALNS